MFLNNVQHDVNIKYVAYVDNVDNVDNVDPLVAELLSEVTAMLVLDVRIVRCAVPAVELHTNLREV